jgi:hypothetical protein
LQNCSELNVFVNRPVGKRLAANGREWTRISFGNQARTALARSGNGLFGEVLIVEFAYFACIRGNSCSPAVRIKGPETPSSPLPKTSFQADNMRFNELLTPSVLEPGPSQPQQQSEKSGM